MSFPPQADGPVLPTMNRDGSRKKLTPKPVKGRFYRRRRAVALALLALFIALPLVHVGGKPLVLLDLPRRQFLFFGQTLFASDTVLLMLLLVSLVVTVFLLTALFGRVWCGWACPQTVYMEFVFRPLERLIEGKAYGSKRRKPATRRFLLKNGVFLLLSLILAHIFLAYFVGIVPLFGWLSRSPFEHPEAFAVMGVTTALIFFDFAYFREQTCIIACPYGRLQAVLLDRQSMIVGYDRGRGEPRGRRSKKLSDEQRARLGDCIECGACTRVCPMGIDIRDGLQLECITCASCVDACDATMARVNQPAGLVRYTSQEEQEQGRRRLLRPRVVIYPAILVLVIALFGVALGQKGSAEVTMLRGITSPYTVLPGGKVSNLLRVKVKNRGGSERSYTLSLAGDTAGLSLVAPQNPLPVAPGQADTATLFVQAPPESFVAGERRIKLRISDGVDFDVVKPYRLLGPTAPGAGEDQTP